MDMYRPYKTHVQQIWIRMALEMQQCASAITQMVKEAGIEDKSENPL